MPYWQVFAAGVALHHRPDGRVDGGGGDARHGLRLGARVRSGLARPRDAGLHRAHPQHAVHRAAVLHLLWAAGGRREAHRDDRGIPRHGDQPRRLLRRDHPRRHPGRAQGPHRGRRQSGDEQLRDLPPRRAEAGLSEDLPGAFLADHHRHARLRGGVADLRARISPMPPTSSSRATSAPSRSIVVAAVIYLLLAILARYSCAVSAGLCSPGRRRAWPISASG